MKILWHSVAPQAATGYGQQTRQAVPRIRDLGHDIAVSCYYGLGGSRVSFGPWFESLGEDWRGIVGYPNYQEPFGTDTIIPNALQHFEVDEAGTLAQAASRGLIITLADVWCLGAPLLPEMCVAAWAPVDHIALPDIIRGWFQQVGAAPIAMSRFGEQAFTKAGFEPIYVPHAIDTNVFSPAPMDEARARAGVPDDRFVVAIVAANVGKDGNRKAFAEQIAAFSAFHRRHDDAFLLLHTDVNAPAGSDVKRLLAELPETAYLITDQAAYRRHVPAERVADIYRSANVFSNATWGEGFGICIVEAQACGTPVVVTDATAMSELCGAGWAVGFEPFWHDSQGAWAAKPRIGEIVQAYEEAYDKAGALREQARDFATMYDADFVAAEYWRPALERLEVALEARAADAETPRSPTMRPALVRVAADLLWYDRGEGSEDGMGPAEHEGVLEPIITDLLPEKGVFMDVGAHVGHWTLRLAKKARHVYAIEANEETAEILRRNVALNDLTSKVTIRKMAAWDRDEALSLHDPHDHLAGGSTTVMAGNAPRARGKGDGTTWGHRIDEVFAATPHVDLIKLDVEGADLRALEGMRGLLERCGPTLFIERHDMYGYYDLEDLEAVLTSLGYRWRTAAHYYNSGYLVAVPVGTP